MKSALLAILCALLIAGCSNKEREEQLQGQLAQVSNMRDSLQQSLSQRDQYLEEVMKTVTDVYTDLEKTRVKEHKLMPSGSQEHPKVMNANTRQQLLSSVNEIGSALKDNQKKISDLAARLKKAGVESAKLNELIETMKTDIMNREQEIAQLKSNVEGLTASIGEKSRIIQVKDSVIGDQQKKMNTVYYIAGTRDELKEKGIITKDGGFLWGLLGSTTVLTGSLDTTQFQRLDKTAEQTIHLQGKVDQILPQRSPDSYTESTDGEQKNSDLQIIEPNKFWANRYLVVILD